MRELISFSFKSAKKQFLAVTKFCAAWTDNKTKFKTRNAMRCNNRDDLLHFTSL